VATTIIYYDFTSVESFLLNEAIAAGIAEPGLEWRGVQMDPSRAVPPESLDRHVRGRLEMDVADGMRTTPWLGIAFPQILPNTRRALLAAASVDLMHPARAAEFRTTLFREYWRASADLSDPVILRQLADVAHVPPSLNLEHPDAEAALAAWDVDWKAADLGGLPRVIRPDGRILWGAKNTRVVQEFFAEP